MISLLVEAAIRSIGVAFLVGIGLRLFGVRNVLAQKAAWSLVLAAALVMPLAQLLPRSWHGLPVSIAIHMPIAASPQSQQLPVASPATTLHAPSTAQRFQIKPVVAGGNRFPAPLVFQPDSSPSALLVLKPAADEPAPNPSRLAALWATLRGVSPLAFAWFLYCAVFAVLLMRLSYGLAMAARIWHAAERVALDPEIGFDSAIAVRSSAAVSSPVTVGSGVILPTDYEHWNIEKLRIVLAHEESHIRHGDFYLQVVAGVYGALFWFSPLGWWLKRKLSELGEAISDLAGLGEAASRISYAQLLVEFAALPRPTLIGVAMARTNNLSLRIDRLLDESIFRQAFAGKRRLLLAVLLVPVALVAATAIVRVEAAESAHQTLAIGAAQSQAASSGESNPVQASAAAVPQAPDAPAAPSAAQAPLSPPTPDVPGSAAIPDGAPAVPPQPPSPDRHDVVIVGDGQTMTITRDKSVTNTNNTSTGQGTSVGGGFVYSYSDGDTWALVTDPSGKITFSGDWNDSTRQTIDRVRKLANGKFLWFQRDGKSYFISDPATISQIQTMYAPIESLGKLQEALGLQQEALGKQQEKLGRQQESVSVRVPDLSKEMAELNAATAKLQAKAGAMVSQEELAKTEAKLAEVQSRLGELQGEFGDRQGSFGELQGKLGEQQGKLGAEQGRLGEKQGRLSEEVGRKVRSIINESLRNGSARPVQ